MGENVENQESISIRPVVKFFFGIYFGPQLKNEMPGLSGRFHFPNTLKQK
jgi:hypothetical protein